MFVAFFGLNYPYLKNAVFRCHTIGETCSQSKKNVNKKTINERTLKMKTITNDFRRGEIYYIEKSENYGSEQQAGRPAVIVSNDTNNEHSATVEVVYLTTRNKNELPTHVRVNGTGITSTALCEQVATIDKGRILTRRGNAPSRKRIGRKNTICGEYTGKREDSHYSSMLFCIGNGKISHSIRRSYYTAKAGANIHRLGKEKQDVQKDPSE